MQLHQHVVVRKSCVPGTAPSTVQFCTLSEFGEAHPWEHVPDGWRDVLDCVLCGFIAHRDEDNRLLLIFPLTLAERWGNA